MIITLKDALTYAEERNMAIAAINVTTLEGAMAVTEAAEETNCPVILQFASSTHGHYITLDAIGPVLMSTAKRSTAPVCVHLDHGARIEDVQLALDMGFTGVMYDGSSLPFEENIENTSKVVELAEKYGASVEAELGSMGRQEFSSVGGNEDSIVESKFTDPDSAAEFVKKTKVHSLACSFGAVHGIYTSEPNLDFDRIEAIREKTGIPVVMHGGSGLSEEDFRNCIARGVRKINYYTYAAKEAGEYIKEQINNSTGNIYYHDIAVWGRTSMRKKYIEVINTFMCK